MPGAEGLNISHDKEPIRLFRSDFLEFFTHIHPAVVLAVWSPVVALFLFVAVRNAATGAGGNILSIVAGFVLGLFLWTLAEYVLHRFVFHFQPRNRWQKRASFLFHGIHHAQPKCKTRLVMPPVVSIPLAMLFYGLFWLVLDVALGLWFWTAPAFAGFISGYLIYDMIHYVTHHLAMRRHLLKALKRHHMQHHYKTPAARFGVSSPLWDLVWGTLPAGKGEG